MLLSELEKAAQDGVNAAKGIPEAALDLIEGYKIVQAQSQGMFSFVFTDITASGVEMLLTFKKADGDVELPAKVDHYQGEIVVGTKSYSKEKIWLPKPGGGQVDHIAIPEEAVTNAIKVASRMAMQCIQLRDAQQATPAVPGQTQAAPQQPSAADMSLVREMQEQLAGEVPTADIHAAVLAGFQAAEAEITEDQRAGKGLIKGLNFIRAQTEGFKYAPDYHADGGVTITATLPQGRDIIIEVSKDGGMEVDGTTFSGTQENLKQVVQLIAKEARAAQVRPAAADSAPVNVRGLRV